MSTSQPNAVYPIERTSADYADMVAVLQCLAASKLGRIFTVDKLHDKLARTELSDRNEVACELGLLFCDLETRSQSPERFFNMLKTHEVSMGYPMEGREKSPTNFLEFMITFLNRTCSRYIALRPETTLTDLRDYALHGFVQETKCVSCSRRVSLFDDHFRFCIDIDIDQIDLDSVQPGCSWLPRGPGIDLTTLLRLTLHKKREERCEVCNESNDTFFVNVNCPRVLIITIKRSENVPLKIKFPIGDLSFAEFVLPLLRKSKCNYRLTGVVKSKSADDFRATVADKIRRNWYDCYNGVASQRRTMSDASTSAEIFFYELSE